MKKIIKTILTLGAVLLFSIPLLADNPSSDNYILKAHTLSTGTSISNASSSSSYILQGSVFGIISGQEAISTNYNLLPGYYLGIDETGELLPPTNVMIWITGGNLYLEWDEVTGANSYKIYATDDPYLEDWGTEVAVVGIPEYDEPVSQMRKFYRIVSSTETPPVFRRLHEVRRSLTD